MSILRNRYAVALIAAILGGLVYHFYMKSKAPKVEAPKPIPLGAPAPPDHTPATLVSRLGGNVRSANA